MSSECYVMLCNVSKQTAGDNCVGQQGISKWESIEQTVNQTNTTLVYIASFPVLFSALCTACIHSAQCDKKLGSGVWERG